MERLICSACFACHEQLGTLPAADKNFVYFITDGDPDSGQGVGARIHQLEKPSDQQ